MDRTLSCTLCVACVAACGRAVTARSSPPARDAVADVAPDAAPNAAPPPSPSELRPIRFPFRPAGCDYVVARVTPNGLPAFASAERTGTAPMPRNLHLSFAGDARRSVVVQWSTDAHTQQNDVRIGSDAAHLERLVRGYSFTYAGAAGRRQHEVHVCGLEPSHTYFYDAGGDGARSRVHHFVTAPDGPQPVKVLVLGDMRTDLDAWRQVATQARTEAPDVMLVTGDAVESAAVQSQWDAMFAAAEDLWADAPAVCAHGTHESLNEIFFAQFAEPGNATGSGLEQWFALTYGPLRIVVLNDTVLSFGAVLEDESDFLRSELGTVDRARTPFVVTMHHEPMYTTSEVHRSNVAIRAAWAPLYDAWHVDADLTGHVHLYESSRPMRGGSFTSDGEVTDSAHGTRYFAFGGGGAPLYGFRAIAPWTQTRESVHGYAMLTAGPTTMRWTARRADGSVIETIDFERAAR